MIREYYELTKPGIIYGNALTAIAGFFLGFATFDWTLFLAMLGGLSLVIGSACVFNNYYDREHDAKMERTKSRALAAGKIPLKHALIFGTALLLLGISALLYTNLLALGTALLGFAVYVFFYTPLKSKSPLALYVGAFAGAAPPVVGYTAATNSLDVYALALFLALYLWQIPHFLAIAAYRYAEYTAAGIPLFIQKEPGETAKRRARLIFYLSLVVLLLACFALILQRWVR